MNDSLDDIFEESWPDDHRSGVVAVVGRPNVGKSTLINRILGQKIAIVTSKPQTTRKRQLGIYTVEHAQVLFIDTPGIHLPHNKLGEYMVDAAEYSLRDADVILWVLDTAESPGAGEAAIAETILRAGSNAKIVLALNKSDVSGHDTDFTVYTQLIPHHTAINISALHGDNVDSLLDTIITMLPEGPRYYPQDQVSEVNMRFIAAEMVREAIIEHTEQEIPYSVAVEVDSFKEHSEDMTYISAVIYVERDSQKGIIVGNRGSMIKRIGTHARTQLSDLLGTKVFLDLHVKVLKDWRSNESLMSRVGYRLPKKDD